MLSEKRQEERIKSEATGKLFKELIKKYEKLEKKSNSDYDSMNQLLQKIQDDECNGRDVYKLEDNVKAINEIHFMSFEDYIMKVYNYQNRKKDHDSILLGYGEQFESLQNHMKEQDLVFKHEQSELDKLKKEMTDLDNAKRAIEAVTMDINNQIKTTNNEKENVETWVKGIQKKLATLISIEQALQNEVNNSS